MSGKTAAGCHAGPKREHRVACRVVLVIAGLLIIPATLTLRTVLDPGSLQLKSSDPTPLGYTWSLVLFLVPLAALSIWFARRRDLLLARRAFWRTIVALAPLGIGLDLLFGNFFFIFTNHSATLGLKIPAMGGGIPIEE